MVDGWGFFVKNSWLFSMLDDEWLTQFIFWCAHGLMHWHGSVMSDSWLLGMAYSSDSTIAGRFFSIIQPAISVLDSCITYWSQQPPTTSDQPTNHIRPLNQPHPTTKPTNHPPQADPTATDHRSEASPLALSRALGGAVGSCPRISTCCRGHKGRTIQSSQRRSHDDVDDDDDFNGYIFF